MVDRPFDVKTASEVVLELIRAGKINLPEALKCNGEGKATLDDLLQERARVQAKYLRALLAELTVQPKPVA